MATGLSVPQEAQGPASACWVALATTSVLTNAAPPRLPHSHRAKRSVAREQWHWKAGKRKSHLPEKRKDKESVKILPLIKLQPTENETEISNRSWFPGRSHQQKTKKKGEKKMGGGRHSVLYNLGLPSTNTVEGRASCKFFVRHLQRQRKAERPGNLALLSLKTTEGRASWKFLVCHLQRQGKEERPGNSQFASYKDKGRQSVLENLGLPPTKTTQGRASWKFLVCHLQRQGKAERPGNSQFATYKEEEKQRAREGFRLPPRRKREQSVKEALGLPPRKENRDGTWS